MSLLWSSLQFSWDLASLESALFPAKLWKFFLQ